MPNSPKAADADVIEVATTPCALSHHSAYLAHWRMFVMPLSLVGDSREYLVVHPDRESAAAPIAGALGMTLELDADLRSTDSWHVRMGDCLVGSVGP
jgi:hypothetical protein